MSEVAVFSNPIRRRRRNRLGEFVSAHRRRRHRNPESPAERSEAARKGWNHRRRRHRNPESERTRSAAARRGWRGRRRHRNPIAGTMGEMSNVIIPAAIGVGGALGLNILLGKLTMLPASLQSGYGRAGVQIAGALAIGALGPKIGLSRRNSTVIAAGITMIALYDVVSAVVAAKFPNINLGETFPALPGGVMTGKNIARYQPTGMGEYFGTPRIHAVRPAASNASTFG